MIAALFVATGGVYFDLPGVDPWDEPRDARNYAGNARVIAHPPCARWSRYWGGGPMLAGTPRQKILGDDAGCFASALASVRKWGGVLEHPEATHAWRVHEIARPPRAGGWVKADELGGLTCCVEQGHYGHRSRKMTWLYAVGISPPELKWGPSEAKIRMDLGFHSREERAAAVRRGATERLSKREHLSTPAEFRDLLISMVENG